MKVYESIFLITLFFLASIAFGQSIDVETELFPGTKKLIVKSFKDLDAEKGFKAIYYFDNNGHAVKSLNYFKRQLRASYEYYYNDKGLLIKKIKSFDINNKNNRDTTSFEYTVDTNGKVTSKTERFGKWSVTENFTEFDTFINPQPVQETFNNRTLVIKRKFNSKGKEVLSQSSINDTIFRIEESKYNDYGDKVYSNVPTLIDKESGKMIQFIVGSRYTGCRRYSVIEVYEYKYDKFHRWTEKYVIFDNRKVLLEKRIYK